MNKNSRIFRRFATVAILALMLQVLMPLLQPAMAASVALSTGPALHHCSTIHNSTNQSESDKASPHGLPSCPICMAMHMQAGGYTPPQNVVLAYLGHSISVVEPLVDTVFVSDPKICSAQARAPPSLA
jgi:hypothetical protein